MAPNKSKNRKKSIVLCSIIIASLCEDEDVRTREWCKEWLQRRKEKGSHATILQELRDGAYESDFKNYMRMDPNTFYDLLVMIEPFISKQDTCMRENISPEARLEATMLFLSTGCSYTPFSTEPEYQNSLSEIIPETCQAIFAVLKDKYLKTPQTAEEWRYVAEDFRKIWNFLICIGALDGKHILIKRTYLHLMALCDANSNFLYVDVGINGRVSDGGVWNKSTLCMHIENGSAGLPDDIQLPNCSKILPFVIVVDDAYPLKRHIMKPFSHRDQNLQQSIFSYWLSRARNTVENAFGRLAYRFHVFKRQIDLEPKKLEQIVLACTAQHNYLHKVPVTPYLCINDKDNPMLSLERQNSTIEGTVVRNMYMKYFNEEGTVIWQCGGISA
ncbi:uncharacterized protein LOC135209284 [Macrobrachium nipponense]|uniref:uncharacterized protein LOC135209284 n=1 Tax=Macrobrachium nipponense TaxID=159736 RepID=UPI0030C89320